MERVVLDYLQPFVYQLPVAVVMHLVFTFNLTVITKFMAVLVTATKVVQMVWV